MQTKKIFSIALFHLLAVFVAMPYAQADDDCKSNQNPEISFIQLQSIDLQTSQPLTVKGKLSIPAESKKKKYQNKKNNLAAIVILHGSAGVDSRGDFYARALHEVGIATLEIDMWEARGVTSLANRPAHPILTYPDAFAALAFLSAYPRVDPNRIGVMGFSWGGVVTLASATQVFATQFGGRLRFKAHVAHYPVCYAYNNPSIPNSEFGGNASNPLTGSPVLIQIGTNDDYDEGAERCIALKAGLPPGEQGVVEVVPYEGAYHAWDRLQVPVLAEDSFAHLGAGGETRIIPSVEQAYTAREKAVRFFLKNL